MSTTGVKSPKAPRNTLKECVELTQKLFKEASRSFVARPTAAKAMGYSGLSGSSLTLLASLVGYGLLSKKGSEVKVSELAIEILHPTNDEQRSLALKKAALSPALFTELAQNHGDCSEAVLSSKLIQNGFAPEAAKRTASVFIANKEFANLNDKVYSDGAENDDKNEPADKQEAAIKGKIQPIAPTLPNPPMHPTLQALANINELTVPIGDNQAARVPFPMSAEDFDLFLDTLKLWKKKIVKEPTRSEPGNVDG